MLSVHNNVYIHNDADTEQDVTIVILQVCKLL